MARIPWIIYAIVGGGMLYVLYYIDNPKFAIFNYIAYAFIIIAIFKMLVFFMLGKKRKTVEPKLKPSQMPAEEEPKAKFVCKYCRTPLPPAGRFCPNCGARVRI